MAHPNEDVLRDAYAAFARGDLQAYLSYCTDDVTFHVPGHGRVAGDYSRAEFVTPFISQVVELTNGTFREEVLDVVANDRRGVVLLHHEFERDGQRYDYRTAHLYRIEQGKLAEFAEYPADLYRFDEAWG